MGRSLVLALASAVVCSGFAADAAAEDIVGHVYGFADPLTHTRPPLPGQFVYLTSEVVGPDGPIQFAAYSGPDGSFRFSGLMPGLTYSLRRVSNDPLMDMQCPFRMVYFPPGSPPGFPGMLLPNGLALPPGPPSNVDLNAPDTCALSSPCSDHFVAANVIEAVLLELDLPTARWTDALVFHRIPDLPDNVVGSCMDPPTYRMRVDPDVKIEWLESPVPRTTYVGPASTLAAAPLLNGDRVRVSIDPDQPALAHQFGLAGRSSFEFTFNPTIGLPIPLVEFHFQRVFELSGRAFVEHGTENRVFDGVDLPLPGLVVEVFDDFFSPDPAPPVARTTTDGEGRYRFIDLPQAYYRIVLRTPGPDADPAAVRLAQHDTPPPADFPFTEADCPHLPCASGDVHEVAFDARVFVGDVDPTAPVVVDFVDLLDGCDSRSRLERACGCFAGPRGRKGRCSPLRGPSGVAVVESFDVADGFATVRIRLTATGAAFPAGFFGDVERRLVVSVNGHAGEACVRFACEALQPGAVLSLAPSRSDRRCRPDPAGSLTVVDLWGWRAWRTCIPAGRCPDGSTTLAGGVERAEFDVDLRAPSKCATKRKSHSLEATFSCGGLSDSVRVSFDGDSLSRETVGRRGVLTVTKATRLPDGTWRLSVRLLAPDRADGNPGALPLGECRLEAQVDDATTRVRLDFGRLPFATGLSSVRWLNAIDAGCGVVGR